MSCQSQAAMADTVDIESELWHLALSAQELASLPSEPSMEVRKVAGHCILLVAGHGQYHALDARCGHRGGPLEEGDLEDLEDLEGLLVRCPWHGRRYRVDTGCEVLQSGETLPTPTQRCHSLRLDSDGALRVRLAPRDDHVASDEFAAIEDPKPPATAASSLQIWLGDNRKEPTGKEDFISDEFLF
ncbi:unnamed protein product [Cladocopium goreaui]|uniref:Rieske domain-containing protein n=1 Tax=Cladocopium goreaui TaxID=2562237 RepID=A0A9P1BVC6_9DINO|nr:unnamed protein product [Cladocopium goreaui]